MEPEDTAYVVISVADAAGGRAKRHLLMSPFVCAVCQRGFWSARARCTGSNDGRHPGTLVTRRGTTL